MNTNTFFEKVQAQLDRAYLKHGCEPWGRHEFYGILKEEVDEAWDAIKADEPLERVIEEVLQIACVCKRFYETGDRHAKQTTIEDAARNIDAKEFPREQLGTPSWEVKAKMAREMGRKHAENTRKDLERMVLGRKESEPVSVMPLVWSENRKPNETIPYDHCIAETPFGRFVLTWKGWKDEPSYDIDEEPWGPAIWNCVHDWTDLNGCKAACQAEFDRRVRACLR